MRAFSRDLRARIAAAFTTDATSFEIGDRFGVSASFVRKLRSQVDRNGHFEAGPTGGARPRALDDNARSQVRALVAEMSDATLRELCSELEKRTSQRVSEPTMWRALRDLGITRKKRLFTRPSANSIA